MTEDVNEATIRDAIERIRTGETMEVSIGQMNKIIERFRYGPSTPLRRLMTDIRPSRASVRLAREGEA